MAEVVPPSRSARPAITIDPWDDIGPELRLPAVGKDRAAGLRWEIHDGSGRREIAGSAHTERVIPLGPTPTSWLIVSREPDRTRRFVYDATGENAIVCFDADTLAYVRDERGIRADHLWILAGADAELGALEADETYRPLVPAEEGAPLAGSWSGHRVARFDLAGVDLLGVRRGEEVIARIPVSRIGEAAELVGAPVRDVSSVDGLPVHAALPGLSLPAFGTWQVSLAGPGRTLSFIEHVTAVRRTVDLAARWGAVGLGSYELVARAMLGRDLRVAFAVVPGLHVRTPDACVLAPDAGAITVPVGTTAPVDLPGTGNPPTVTVEAGDVAVETWAWEHRDAKLGLLVRVPRLRWAIRRGDGELELRPDVLPLEPDEIGTTARALVVATGRPGASVRVVVAEGRGPVQEARSRPTGPEGTVAIEIAAFRDAARAATDGFTLRVEVGDIRTVAAEHRVARRYAVRADLPRQGASVRVRVVSVTSGALGVKGDGWGGVIHADRMADAPRDHAVGEELDAWIVRVDDPAKDPPRYPAVRPRGFPARPGRRGHRPRFDAQRRVARCRGRPGLRARRATAPPTGHVPRGRPRSGPGRRRLATDPLDQDRRPAVRAGRLRDRSDGRWAHDPRRQGRALGRPWRGTGPRPTSRAASRTGIYQLSSR